MQHGRKQKFLDYIKLAAFLGIVLIGTSSCATTRDDSGKRIFPEKQIVPAQALTNYEKQMLSELADSQGDMHNLLKTLVQIESVNPKLHSFSGRSEIFYYADAYLSDRGMETKLIPVEGTDGTLYNLIAVLEGRGPGNTLLFCGHLDTVPYDSRFWDKETPPLGGVQKDNRVYGRGALDMKGGVAVMMSVMAELADRGAPFSGKLMLLLTPDEETGGGYGSKIISELYPDILHAGLTLIAEPTQSPPLSSPAIIMGEKSPVWLRLTFIGESGHSSAPIPGSGGLDKAVAFISGFDQFSFPDGEGMSSLNFAGQMLKRFTLWDAVGASRNNVHPSSILTESTVSFTGFQAGGIIINQVPAAAEVTADFRILPGITPGKLLESLEVYAESLGYQMMVQTDENADISGADIFAEVLLAAEGTVESIDTPEAKLFSEAFEAVYKTAPVHLVSPGFTDAGNLRSSGLRNVFVTGPAGAHPHGAHEYVELDSLNTLQQLYFLTALRYLQ